MNNEFSECGYTVLRQALDQQACALYASYALLQRFNPGHYEAAQQRVYQGRYNRYGDALGESLLVNLKPLIETATGHTLFPTYSFLRIYETGAELLKHTDRPACEISVSLPFGYAGAELWPLWLEGRNGPLAVALAPGDLLIYRGCDLPHWREPFAGRYWIQLFLHYVDAHGPRAAYKYDGRPMPGLGRRSGPNPPWLMTNAGEMAE